MSSRTRQLVLSCIIFGAWGTAGLAYANGAPDPCDFAQGSSFDYHDVLACYRSVPWCSDPTDPVRCDRDNQVEVIDQTVGRFSTLRGNYDAENGWRAHLAAISSATFDSDYAQHLAFNELLKEFRNLHWVYAGPACYYSVVFAAIPMDFGSTYTRTRLFRPPEQVIYLEAPYALAAWYQAETGIDLTQYEGMRVVSIDGRDPLEYFEGFGIDQLRWDDDPGINLMSILEFGTWSIRSGPLDALPEAPFVTMVLETRRGRRHTVQLPWAFGRLADFGVGGPVPSSSEQFHGLCFGTWPPPDPDATSSGDLASAVRSATDPSALRQASRSSFAPRSVAFDLIARRNLIDRLESGAARSGGRGARTRLFREYYEVPPWALDQDTTELLPLTDGARVVEYAGETVAIQLNYDFVQPWLEEVEQAGTYACDNADRLIIDLRNNFGGYIAQAEWLAQYLEPNAPFTDTRWVFRDLALEPAVNELRAGSEWLRTSLASYFPGSTVPPCWFTNFESTCHQSTATQQLFTDPLWYLSGSFSEVRGFDVERLTEKAVQPSYLYFPPAPILPCAGKFTGKDLIVLVNGVNASAGFLTPELLRNVGTVVVAGGLVGEEMTTGNARGGNVWETSYYVDVQDYIAQLASAYIPGFAGATRFDLFEHPVSTLARDVTITLEEKGNYALDGVTLSFDTAPKGEVQIPFWSNSYETDGAAYRAAISAVEQQATIEPVCGSPSDHRFCFRYGRCARRALDAAVADGRVSAATAGRVHRDVLRSCRGL